MEQKYLDFAASRAFSKKPRGDDLGIVQDEAIALAEVAGDITELPVLDFMRRAIQYHQTALLALFRGVLCNAFLRQDIIEFG
jgi:hypothetical protein